MSLEICSKFKHSRLNGYFALIAAGNENIGEKT